LFSPSGSLKYLWTGSALKLCYLLITQREPWGFIMFSAQNKAVHMQLSLRLSFQLRRSFEGYMVGTIAGFQL
jgi:hypothetical protein